MSRRVQLTAKRLLDILVAAAGLVLLLPLFALVAVCIRVGSRGPVFFSQERAGCGGKPFRISKFRTMVEHADRIGSGLYVSQNDSRITSVGKILRRLSIDELPQLLHILTGRMSLVGPRPALPYQVELYTTEQARRLLMRPGLTGWSQVNGRNLLSWPERIEKDIWYVDNFSLWLDARILLRTLKVWISGNGIYAPRDRFFFSAHDDIPAPSRKDS
jgi:lipopolysaccharide/colanic/teichoic acid biosynthesis glycosyltransferase